MSYEDRFDVRIGFDGANACYIVNIYAQHMPGHWYVVEPIILKFRELTVEGECHEPSFKINHLEGELLRKAFDKAIMGKTQDEKDITIKIQKERIEMLQDQIDDLRELLKLEKPARPRRRIET
jgi:hypothetical protein